MNHNASKAGKRRPDEDGPSSLLGAVIVSLRPQQWVKNLACGAGLVFSGRMFQFESQLRTLAAFVGFSAAASAVYLFNDLRDRNRDSLNPRTANRPIASGRLPAGSAVIAAASSVTIAFVISQRIAWGCLVVAAAYLAMNVAYSLRLKRTVIADVICIALGFVLRVLYGVYAVEVLPTPWIVLCMFSLALFLGFGKRRAELRSLTGDAIRARPVLAKYSLDFLNFAIGMSATLTATTYALYCIAPHHDPNMIITILPVVYCVLRYAHQLYFEERGQSPERLLFADKMLWVGIAVWVATSVTVIYCRPNWLEFAPS